MLSAKSYDYSFKNWKIKKIYKSGYYPEPDSHYRSTIKLELDLSNYLELGKKVDLASLKSDILDTS